MVLIYIVLGCPRLRLLFWSPFALLNAILKGKHFPQGALRIHSGKLWSKYVGTVLVAWENSQQFRDATTGFPAKWRLRNERRNSILMTRYYPDVGFCFWLDEANFHQHRISALAFSDVVSSRNQCWHREMLAFFSGYCIGSALVQV